MPVLVGVSPGPDSKYTTIGHWLVFLSISGDTVTISNAGRDSENGTETDNINTLVEKYMEGNGYILVKSAKTDSATNVKEVSTDTEKKKKVVQHLIKRRKLLQLKVDLRHVIYQMEDMTQYIQVELLEGSLRSLNKIQVVLHIQVL